MAGRNKLKLIAESVMDAGHGWDLDPATHDGAHAAYRQAFGAAAAQVKGTGLIGSGKGRGPMIVDAFRPRADGAFDFLSIKGHSPWPSKSVITTGKGAECLMDAAALGINVPCVSMVIFDSMRVSVRVYDLAAMIREHGVIDPPSGGFGRGKAPPLFWATTRRESGTKRAVGLLNAGAIDADEYDAMTTIEYRRIEMSFAALGWSKGRGWTHINPLGNGEIDGAAIRQAVEDLYDWSSAVYSPMIG